MRSMKLRCMKLRRMKLRRVLYAARAACRRRTCQPKTITKTPANKRIEAGSGVTGMIGSKKAPALEFWIFVVPL